ncbi:hypothetical protein [Caenibacillus caldisaponilyticus]|uniref:hypothetical protein n=1 Tax=Caenibacillus caldisaponilyticus TaxID=1674942 RepID=UPI00117830A3|nr:hypothetical protein [Caenibacillus caldisaponilyticus]
MPYAVKFSWMLCGYYCIIALTATPLKNFGRNRGNFLSSKEIIVMVIFMMGGYDETFKIFIGFDFITGLALVPFNETSLAATKRLSTKSTAHASYKLTATLDNKHPKQYGTVHLMVKGLPSGTKYKAVFHYRTKDTTYYGKVGKSLTVRISRATKGFKVKINISATYKGKTYKTETYFIPR